MTNLFLETSEGYLEKEIAMNLKGAKVLQKKYL
jgi:hypothetical protein